MMLKVARHRSRGRGLIARLFRRGLRQEGSATIEFVIVFPVFIVMFLNVFEIGLYMTEDVMLNHGVNVAVRALRLSAGDSTITHVDVRKKICDNALVLEDCNNRLKIELVQIDPDTWTMPDPNADCIDTNSDVTPVVNFSTGNDGSIMFLRACLLADPFFPGTGLAAAMPKDDAGYYQLIATSAFANEPS